MVEFTKKQKKELLLKFLNLLNKTDGYRFFSFGDENEVNDHYEGICIKCAMEEMVELAAEFVKEEGTVVLNCEDNED